MKTYILSYINNKTGKEETSGWLIGTMQLIKTYIHVLHHEKPEADFIPSDISSLKIIQIFKNGQMKDQTKKINMFLYR